MRICIFGNPAGLPFFLITQRVKPTPAFEELRPLKKGEQSTGKKMRAALMGPRLFQFVDCGVTPI